MSRMNGHWLLAIAIVFFWGAANAQDSDDKVKFIDEQGPLVLVSSPSDTLVLYLRGGIERDTFDDFLNITRNRNVELIILDSPGDDLGAGIFIAELVAAKGINTWIEKDAFCASACSLIFFAGKERWLEGHVGVHQYRTVGGQADDESAAQERVGRIMELFNSFDNPLIAVEKSAITKPSCMYWFGPPHASMFQRGVDASLVRIEGTLECSDTQKSAPTSTPVVVPTPAPKPQNPAVVPEITSPDLAGSWSLSARCSHTSVVILGDFTARRTAANRYSLLYRNNLGETGTGMLVQKGKLASVTIQWNNGQSTTSDMTVDSGGTHLSGHSNNGCVFEAWR